MYIPLFMDYLKQTEKISKQALSLKESERKFRRLVEGVRDDYIMYAHDVDGVSTPFGLCVTTKESFSIFSLAALSRVISCANPSTAIEGVRDDYIMYAHDVDGVFTYVGPSIKNILGYTPEEFLVHYQKSSL
jgi:uncharacterized membrane protein